MATQAHDLHRSLLRPVILHTLRAAGFHSTRPSVLDTMLNLTERYMLLLATTTAKYAQSSHNDPVPTITDVRMALQDCGVLGSGEGAAEEQWQELLRKPIEVMGDEVEQGGQGRMTAMKRKRQDEDVQDIEIFKRWFDGKAYAEIKRVAGMTNDIATGAAGSAAVGVGGGKVQMEDFLTQLKKRQARVGDLDGDARLAGTVLGQSSNGEERSGLMIEGGPVHGLAEWEERIRQMARAQRMPNEARMQDEAMETTTAAVG